MVAGNQFHNRFKCLVIFPFSVAGSLPLLATAAATLGNTGNNQILSHHPDYAAASGSTSAPCASQQSCPVVRSCSTASLTVTRDRPTTSGALRSNTAALPVRVIRWPSLSRREISFQDAIQDPVRDFLRHNLAVDRRMPKAFLFAAQASYSGKHRRLPKIVERHAIRRRNPKMSFVALSQHGKCNTRSIQKHARAAVLASNIGECTRVRVTLQVMQHQHGTLLFSGKFL